jgi:hypothetical protein
VICNVTEIYIAKNREMDKICSTDGRIIHAYKMVNLMGGATYKAEIWLVH